MKKVKLLYKKKKDNISKVRKQVRDTGIYFEPVLKQKINIYIYKSLKKNETPKRKMSKNINS